MTKEDVIEILERFVIGAKPCSQREIVDACASAYRMLKEQPSLPSNLDEAAQQDAIRTYAMPEDGNIDKIFDVLRARTLHEIGFVACVKWIHGRLDGKLDDSIVNEWASRFSPEIRDSIKNTAYHFWDIAREGLK